MLDDVDYYDIVGIGVFGLGAAIPTGVLNSDRGLQLCWLRRRPLCENSFPSVLFFYHYDIVGIGVFGLGAVIPTGVLNSDRGLQLCWLRRRPLCENSFPSVLFFYHHRTTVGFLSISFSVSGCGFCCVRCCCYNWRHFRRPPAG